MTTRPFLWSAAFCTMLAVSTSTLAQSNNPSNQSRYGNWQNPGAQSEATSNVEVQNLLKDLNTLIKDAEKARAADRLFLQDLKDLSARYENPWTVRLLSDDFRDGNFTRSPKWSVHSGEYWVENGYGLRNKVVQAQAAAPKKMSKEQLAFSILGAVLNGNKATPQATPQAAPRAVIVKPASISTRTRISNAFALTADISSWLSQGRFEIGFTQGTSGAGYRLNYSPGVQGTKSQIELLKVTNRGQSVVESASIAALEDKRAHAIAWTRNRSGNMQVKIDGTLVLTARDQSFRDSFTAVRLTSDGADVIVKSISVMGVR